MKTDMVHRIYKAANATWDAIGGDILAAMEESGAEASMPRDHVVEVVLDADYMKMHGRDDVAYEALQELSYKDRIKVVTKAFQYERYGW